MEIPENLRVNQKDLTYGKVRDFLLLNNKMGLISLGVYAINQVNEDDFYGIGQEDREDQLNSSLNKNNSVSDSDEEFSFTRATTHELGKSK